MTHLIRIGIDLAKQVFQLHGVDARGHTVLRRRVSRRQVRAVVAHLPACRGGLDAGGRAHSWARELRALGDEVRRIAPQFVAPYRTKAKNDGHDAETICEAVGRPHMRFVPVKDMGPQAVLTVHRARQLLVAKRPALGNHSRGLLAAYGLIVPVGMGAVRRLGPLLLEAPEVPALARAVCTDLADRLRAVDERSAADDHRVVQLARQTEPAQRLMPVPGVGPVTATAVLATGGNAPAFRNGRQLAAWLGLVPRQHSRGGTRRLGRITNRGDVSLRTVLIHGACAVCGPSCGGPTRRTAGSRRSRRGVASIKPAWCARRSRPASAGPCWPRDGPINPPGRAPERATSEDEASS